MKTRVFQIGVGILLAALMTFLFIETNVIESHSHNFFRQRLQRLVELDATLDRDVLASRYGILKNSDQFGPVMTELKFLKDQLKAAPLFLEADKRAVLNENLRALGELQNQKETLIERFNSLKVSDVKTNPEAAAPEADALVDQIISVPTITRAEEIIKSYDFSYEELMQRADTYRLLLYVFSVVLLAYIAFIFVRLRKATTALKSVNENLEQIVMDRTFELTWSHDELQKSENNIKALLHAMPDSIWRINKSGKFLNWKPAKGEETAVDNEEWENKTIHDVLPIAVAQQIIYRADQALNTGETEVFEFQRNANNKMHHYEARVDVCGEDEILTIVRDITTLKEAQTESQLILEIIKGISTTSNLKELFQHVHKSLCGFLYAENCYVAIYDSKTQRLDMQFYIDKNDDVPPPIRLGRGLTSYIFENAQPMLLSNERISELVDSGDVEMFGTPPAIWLGVPLRTPKGVIGVLVVQHYEDSNAYNTRDLKFLASVGDQLAVAIERKRAELALSENEAKFRDLFDNAPVAYHELDVNGCFTRVNNTEEILLGYSEYELKGRHASEIIKESTAKNLNAANLAEIPSLKAVERTFIRKDGSEVSVLSEDRLIYDSNGNITGIRSTLQDITERKLLEGKLQRAQKLESIGQLAAGIAHEINTPTQYVGDNVRFLRDSFDDFNSVFSKTAEIVSLARKGQLELKAVSELETAMEKADLEYLIEEVPKSVRQALDGVERISTIVKSMKDFAHPGSSEMKCADINKAIESTITVASNEWKYVANVFTDYDKSLPPVPCLVGEFNQVILNMIVNAAHAITDALGENSAEKGTIAISTKQKGNSVEISITDTGVGIPEEIRGKIFDPFFTTKEVGKGTGQGLAISHTVIVEKHHGTIDVMSEVGKGSKFTISLPLGNGSEAPTAAI